MRLSRTGFHRYEVDLETSRAHDKLLFSVQDWNMPDRTSLTLWLTKAEVQHMMNALASWMETGRLPDYLNTPKDDGWEMM